MELSRAKCFSQASYLFSDPGNKPGTEGNSSQRDLDTRLTASVTTYNYITAVFTVDLVVFFVEKIIQIMCPSTKLAAATR